MTHQPECLNRFLHLTKAMKVTKGISYVTDDSLRRYSQIANVSHPYYLRLSTYLTEGGQTDGDSTSNPSQKVHQFHKKSTKTVELLNLMNLPLSLPVNSQVRQKFSWHVLTICDRYQQSSPYLFFKFSARYLQVKSLLPSIINKPCPFWHFRRHK